MKKALGLHVGLTILMAIQASAEIRPVLLVQAIPIKDEAKLSAAMEAANQSMREGHGVPVFLRAYAKEGQGSPAQEGFLLSPALSREGLDRNWDLFFQEAPNLHPLSSLAALIRDDAQLRLEAARFDGTHKPGFLCNLWIACDDEALLLARIEALAAALESDEHPRPFINVFRVLTGGGSRTHLVSINAESNLLRAAALQLWAGETDPLDHPSIRVLDRSLFREVVGL